MPGQDQALQRAVANSHNSQRSGHLQCGQRTWGLHALKLEVSLYGSGPGGKEVLEDRKGHRDCSQPPDPLCPRTSKGTHGWVEVWASCAQPRREHTLGSSSPPESPSQLTAQWTGEARVTRVHGQPKPPAALRGSWPSTALSPCDIC